MKRFKYPKTIAILLIVIIIFFSYKAVNLQLDPSFDRLIPDDSTFNTNDAILRNAFGANDAILVLFEFDDTIYLENTPEALSEESIGTYVKDIKETLQNSQYATQISQTQYTDTVAQFSVILQTPESVGSFKDVLQELNTYLDAAPKPPGVKVTITGMPVMMDRISRLLINDNLVTIGITLIFIFLILFYYSKNLAFTAMTLIAPISSIIILAGSMVMLNIPVTITLAAVGVLMLGLGADYSIHLATHYQHHIEEHESHLLALKHTFQELFIPITASFLTTLAGFSALLLGVSPSSQAQGIVLSLGITIIYFSTFVLYGMALYFFGDTVAPKHNYFFDIIQRGLVKLAQFQAHFPKTVITIIVVITVVMFAGLTQVEFSTSNSNWIPDDDPTSESFRTSGYAFGNTDTIQIILMAEDGDLRDVQIARDVNTLLARIKSMHQISRISSPYEGIPYNSEEIYNTITNERRDQFNEDFTITRINLVCENLESDSSGKSPTLEELRVIVEEYPVHNTKVTLYGDIIRFDELSDNLQKDTGITTIVGLLLVFIVASGIYMSIKIGFLALLPIIIAIIWALGLMGFFGVPFTSLSSGIITLVLGIGVDFSIHLVDTIQKNLKKSSIEKSIEKTMTSTGSAIVLSSITTMIGFLALTFATLLGTKRLGWSLAFSIISVFIVSITLIPAILSLLSQSIKSKRGKQRT